MWDASITSSVNLGKPHNLFWVGKKSITLVEMVQSHHVKKMRWNQTPIGSGARLVYITETAASSGFISAISKSELKISFVLMQWTFLMELFSLIPTESCFCLESSLSSPSTQIHWVYQQQCLGVSGYKISTAYQAQRDLGLFTVD